MKSFKMTRYPVWRTARPPEVALLLAIGIVFDASGQTAGAQSALAGSRVVVGHAAAPRDGDIPRYQEVFIDNAVEYNAGTCAQVDTGTWTVDAQPTYGTLSLRTRSAPLASGACPGVNFTFAAIYYTWQTHSNESNTDSFSATYNSKSFHEPYDYSVTVPIVVPDTETTQAKGWDAEGLGIWQQKLGNQSDPTFDWSFDQVQETDPGTGKAKNDTCWCPGSAIAPFWRITGGVWTLATDGTWNDFDHVGWCAIRGSDFCRHSTLSVGYYRQKRRAPCGTTLPQQMQFQATNISTDWVDYGPINKLGGSFTYTTVTSTRAGKKESHRFSPKKTRARIACKLFKGPSPQLVAGKSASFTDPRPLAAALDALEQSFGMPITYEDPAFGYSAHLTSMVQSADDDSALLMPKGGTLRFVPSAKTGDALSRAQDVVAAYNAGREVATFSVRQGKVPHVVPDGIADQAGHLTRTTPVLDTRITLERKSRTLLDLVADITESVSKQTGYSIGLGTVPTGLLRSEKVTLGAANKPARDVLDEALFSGSQKLSWRLLYDPGLKSYFLNIHVL